MTRTFARLATDRGGASAVEFALIAPVLLLMMCGTCVYAVWFLLAVSVQSLAVESARASLAGLDDSERRTLAEAFIQKRAAQIGLPPSHVTQTVEIDRDGTRVTVRFDASDHPAMALKHLVPAPPDIIERTAVVAGTR